MSCHPIKFWPNTLERKRDTSLLSLSPTCTINKYLKYNCTKIPNVGDSMGGRTKVTVRTTKGKGRKISRAWLKVCCFRVRNQWHKPTESRSKGSRGSYLVEHVQLHKDGTIRTPNGCQERSQRGKGQREVGWETPTLERAPNMAMHGVHQLFLNKNPTWMTRCISILATHLNIATWPSPFRCAVWATKAMPSFTRYPPLQWGTLFN